MQRILFILVLLLIGLLFLGWLFIRQVGNIVPTILPTEKKTEEIKTPGYKIEEFVDNLDNARDLEVSPGGTILLSITGGGRVVALPDKNKDGKADEVKDILTNLDRPHGLAFFDNKLFVAEETQVTRYNWNEEALQASLDKVLFSLPSGGRHFTRSLVFDREGKLFVSVGSTCDVCEERDERLAAVLTSDLEGNNLKVYAKGLRNSVFITINPTTGELWGTEMGRDFLGDNLPPDEINIIREGKNYGWPLCFGNRVHDTDFDKRVYIQMIPQLPCGTTEPPIYEIAAHSAPLGFVFINSPQFPADWQGDLLVAYHGSWNSSVPVGYKVVRMQVEGSKITGEEDFLQSSGRPVDLIFDKEGGLYISDDKAGAVYKVVKE